MVFYTIGQIVKLEGVLLLLPLVVSLVYRDGCWWSFLTVGAAAYGAGYLLIRFCKTGNQVIFAREGFVIVGLSWILLSLIGAVPFTISGQIPSFVDAFFETVSGFTTTGASILTDVESMAKSMLFWRSFTHWIGGMGILVLVVAIFPAQSGRTMHILRAEIPGPVAGKLTPKVRETAKILYLIYLAITALEVILLLCGGMDFFESVLHAFGTAGTGGFGVKADSIASYSPYLQWVIAVFMLLFGVNFNVYYLLLIRRFKSVIKSEELWIYLGIVALSVGLITANIYSIYGNFAAALRNSAFQVSSIITTTGYSTADFDAWPTLSKAILFILMFIGACAGSTGGGLKVSRVALIFKSMKRDVRKLTHPRLVATAQFEGKNVEEETLKNIRGYFAVYMVVFVAVFLLISFEHFSLETNLSATAACLNNIGPGFGAVGPMASYAGYSPFSKIVLSFAMLFGRLELYPLLVLFTPSTWLKK